MCIILPGKGRAVPDLMLPPTFVTLLAAFAGCFTAPGYENFCRVVAG
jgi:hypothetical protein